MPVVVGVLVVREQVLRDPHEDVEANGVAPVQGEDIYIYTYIYIYIHTYIYIYIYAGV